VALKKISDTLSGIFKKLTETKTAYLLIIFSLINFAVRFLIVMPVKPIALLENIIAPHYLNLADSMFSGEGFTTHVIWNLFLLPPKVVLPDFFRMPLYPFFIFLAYKIFGYSFFSAQIVNVMAAGILPLIAYFFSYVLTKSKKISVLLLLFISFNQLIFQWMVLTFPEIIYACFSILTLIFIYKTKGQTSFNSIFVGVFWALAYLSRAEALYIFFPVILFFYFFKENKKALLTKIILTAIGFLAIAAPYLSRNYVLTGRPFFSEFDKILMVSYIGHDRLIESPKTEYANIYDIWRQKPLLSLTIAAKNIFSGIMAVPDKLLSSYPIFIFMLIGLYFTKDRKKYLFIFFTVILTFIITVLSVYFEPRYLIFLIIIFYLFACIGIFHLYDNKFKNNPVAASVLTLYLALFIFLNGFIGVVKGTLPYIPHSFYKRFDANAYYYDLNDIYSYIKDNSKKNDAVMASRRPYGIYYFTKQPTIIFPYATEKEIQSLMKKYNVRWLLWQGQPEKVDDKFWKFFLPDEIPSNITPVLKNSAGDLFYVDYYTEQ